METVAGELRILRPGEGNAEAFLLNVQYYLNESAVANALIDLLAQLIRVQMVDRDATVPGALLLRRAKPHAQAAAHPQAQFVVEHTALFPDRLLARGDLETKTIVFRSSETARGEGERYSLSVLCGPLGDIFRRIGWVVKIAETDADRMFLSQSQWLTTVRQA